MNVLSTFNGMGCIWIALDKLGIEVNKRYSSEIDKFANKVNDKNYPDTIQLGDVTKVKASDLEPIDLLVGGSPCQGFSFAGKQLNFNDPRSVLFFEFVRLLEECKPKYFLLENVKMKKEYEQTITSILGVEPIEINSNLLSAQNRKRLYWTNIPNIEQPQDKNINWGDVREHGVEYGNMYYTDKALDWIGRQGVIKSKKLKVHSDNEKMQMIEASHSKNYSLQRFFGIVDRPPQQVENSIDKIPKDKYSDVFNDLAPGNHYRYITPIECERLQTVPDNYTDCVSKTQRYRMLGNGWTVDVITHILKNIKS